MNALADVWAFLTRRAVDRDNSLFKDVFQVAATRCARSFARSNVCCANTFSVCLSGLVHTDVEVQEECFAAADAAAQLWPRLAPRQLPHALHVSPPFSSQSSSHSSPRYMFPEVSKLL
jgi:hypothetical protein